MFSRRPFARFAFMRSDWYWRKTFCWSSTNCWSPTYNYQHLVKSWCFETQNLGLTFTIWVWLFKLFRAPWQRADQDWCWVIVLPPDSSFNPVWRGYTHLDNTWLHTHLHFDTFLRQKTNENKKTSSQIGKQPNLLTIFLYKNYLSVCSINESCIFLYNKDKHTEHY